MTNPDDKVFEPLRKELASLGLSPQAVAELVDRAKALLPDGWEGPESVQITPVCPRCDHEMVLRTARKGKNAGNRFWGCVNFPRCREIQEA